jgi:hypothetical protein
MVPSLPNAYLGGKENIARRAGFQCVRGDRRDGTAILDRTDATIEALSMLPSVIGNIAGAQPDSIGNTECRLALQPGPPERREIARSIPDSGEALPEFRSLRQIVVFAIR